MTNGWDGKADELPKSGSDLDDWLFFIETILGCESPAFKYLNSLCEKFGSRYQIDVDPEIFYSHVMKFNHSAVVEEIQWKDCEKIMNEGKP